MINHCGNCTACCRVFTISQFDKPAGKWCQHCTIGEGCNIYQSRPKICRDFQCLWLESQSIPGAEFGPELRPDRCKVVFSASTSPKVVSGTTMPGAPLAWRKPEVMSLIKRLITGGVAVVVGLPASTTKTMIAVDGEHEVHMTDPDSSGMQWSLPR
jgi:hypothetical protein